MMGMQESGMDNEHIKALHEARERLVKERRERVQRLLNPVTGKFTGDYGPRVPETQEQIEAVDRAIADERVLAKAERDAGQGRQDQAAAASGNTAAQVYGSHARQYKD
jgi:hypothetical protein